MWIPISLITIAIIALINVLLSVEELREQSGRE